MEGGAVGSKAKKERRGGSEKTDRRIARRGERAERRNNLCGNRDLKKRKLKTRHFHSHHISVFSFFFAWWCTVLVVPFLPSSPCFASVGGKMESRHTQTHTHTPNTGRSTGSFLPLSFFFFLLCTTCLPLTGLLAGSGKGKVENRGMRRKAERVRESVCLCVHVHDPSKPRTRTQAHTLLSLYPLPSLFLSFPFPFACLLTLPLGAL